MRTRREDCPQATIMALSGRVDLLALAQTSGAMRTLHKPVALADVLHTVRGLWSFPPRWRRLLSDTPDQRQKVREHDATTHPCKPNAHPGRWLLASPAAPGRLRLCGHARVGTKPDDAFGRTGDRGRVAPGADGDS